MVFKKKEVFTMARVETTRMGMNIPTELMEQLDEYADRMNISKCGLCVALTSIEQSKGYDRPWRTVETLPRGTEKADDKGVTRSR